MRNPRLLLTICAFLIAVSGVFATSLDPVYEEGYYFSPTAPINEKCIHLKDCLMEETYQPCNISISPGIVKTLYRKVAVDNCQVEPLYIRFE